MTVEKQVRMQRVRVGMTGLAAVVLMVAAAAALFQSTNDNAPPAPVAGANQAAGNLIDPAAETPNEPLAEIGVAPGSGPTETEKAAASKQLAKVPPEGATR